MTNLELELFDEVQVPARAEQDDVLELGHQFRLVSSPAVIVVSCLASRTLDLLKLLVLADVLVPALNSGLGRVDSS